MLASIELTLLICQVNFATLYRYGKINFISNTNLHITYLFIYSIPNIIIVALLVQYRKMIKC